MAVTNTNNMPGGTISINSSNSTITQIKPAPLKVRDDDGTDYDVLEGLKRIEYLATRMEAMADHMEEMTVATGYKSSLTLEERIEQKVFLKKLSGK